MSTTSDPGDPSARIRSAARRVLATFGADLEQASRPATSASNEVWLADEIVLRMSRGNDGSLRRESALASILPTEVGYPTVVGYGVESGYEWMVTERLPGTNLVEAWSTLDVATRRRAVDDLWARLSALRHVDVECARELGFTRTPFYALCWGSATELLGSLTGPGSPIGRTTAARIETILEHTFAAMAGVPLALVHSDAGPHNTVWSGSRSIPVDFEFASVAPMDLELESLFRTLSMLPGPDVSGHLAEHTHALLTRPGARERLQGYALLRDLWVLRGWLRNDPTRRRSPNDDAEIWDLWEALRLHGHADGTSWLARLSAVGGRCCP